MLVRFLFELEMIDSAWKRVSTRDIQYARLLSEYRFWFILWPAQLKQEIDRKPKTVIQYLKKKILKIQQL